MSCEVTSEDFLLLHLYACHHEIEGHDKAEQSRVADPEEASDLRSVEIAAVDGVLAADHALNVVLLIVIYEVVSLAGERR